jgi:hypothetical protein
MNLNLKRILLIGGLGWFLFLIPRKISESVKNLSYLGRTDLPRGMRNNNPGNIERNPNNKWQGRIPVDQQTDPRFEQFSTYPYGTRAMIVLLRNYINIHGANTIRKIIERWAPKDGSWGGKTYNNPTEAYVNVVSETAGLSPDEPVDPDDPEQMYRIVKGMAYMENGVELAVTRPVFQESWKLV